MRKDYKEYYSSGFLSIQVTVRKSVICAVSPFRILAAIPMDPC